MQSQILVGRPSEPVFPPPALDGIYRFRHRVFHQRLGWEVSSARGREMDEYDDLDPVYIAYRRSAEEVIGTFRLLPTTGPYMLRDVFPQLLRGEPFPAPAMSGSSRASRWSRRTPRRGCRRAARQPPFR
ncbi:MAG: acyl-homoserine-lactone synthase [Arhodomonas sp.]|nr:acyl-homoserine-lactone synthase [Arhodomonas sp.]